ncbi:putative DNA-binding protein [Paenibacillus larvae subsp. larvae]|uniref:Putative DNA-binding protein n=1 Tax=Paenibacillus larvae subsp. larvae TaxID=147375 RepID=A0A2L1U590_9BACL|nr:hypothetical protein [Paenibacillus larvae]AVF28103.1 putative DNA-binding protein [Paenibacillus larvae subsp. larvae]AVF32606.1 putative DNA-binding protein [Paenibacillus larvae subsp. larvae]MCY7521073.1 hypothetical protein [Paenibacillus larvae]MCY9512499.1 hypothetical protein [Paenibacillus larvae]MCY9527698.1 hypothetical protein [Paenibacillus larvae]
MDSRIALRVEIENAIVKSGYTLSSLSEYSGLSIGNLTCRRKNCGLSP